MVRTQQIFHYSTDESTEPNVSEADPCRPSGLGAYEPHVRLAALETTEMRNPGSRNDDNNNNNNNDNISITYM